MRRQFQMLLRDAGLLDVPPGSQHGSSSSSGGGGGGGGRFAPAGELGGWKWD
jgi:hypothetical protein